MHASLLVFSLVLNAATTLPSVAMLPVDGKGGVSKDTADLVQESMTDAVRKSGLFSRVVTMADVQALLIPLAATEQSPVEFSTTTDVFMRRYPSRCR